jgi:hypothetical protein
MFRETPDVVHTHTAKAGCVTTVGMALFAKDNPTHLIWRSEHPVWEDTSPAHLEKSVIGAVVYDQDIVLYLTSRREQLITISLPNPYAQQPFAALKTRLHRFPQQMSAAVSGISTRPDQLDHDVAISQLGEQITKCRAMLTRFGTHSNSRLMIR